MLTTLGIVLAAVAALGLLAVLGAAIGLVYLIDLPVLLVLVSLVYSATRYDAWGPILREALRWGLRLLGFLGGIGLALFLLTLL